MSTMTETLREEALFIPSDDTTRTHVPKVEGDYLGHITDTKTIVREFKTSDGRNVKNDEHKINKINRNAIIIFPILNGIFYGIYFYLTLN